MFSSSSGAGEAFQDISGKLNFSMDGNVNIIKHPNDPELVRSLTS